MDMMQHATMEVNLSDNNITRVQSSAALAAFRGQTPGEYETKNSVSTFIGGGGNATAGSKLKSKSMRGGLTMSRCDEAKEKASLLSARISAGMHVLKSYTEKLVDVKQQVRQAQVLLLGDAAGPCKNKPKHLQNATTAANTSHLL